MAESQRLIPAQKTAVRWRALFWLELAALAMALIVIFIFLFGIYDKFFK